MPINYQALSFWFGFAQTFVFIAVGLYMFINRGNQMTKKEATAKIEDVEEKTTTKIEKLSGRVDGHSERISVLEENVRCAPSHKDLGDVYSRINDVAGVVNKMAGTVESMSGNVKLIHKWLIDNGKDKEA